MKRLLIITLLVPVIALADDDKIADQTVYIDEQDRVMDAAIIKARSTLDEFLELHDLPPKGAINFKLKVMLSDDNGVEHFWFTPFKRIEGGFAGVLANNPSVVTSVEYGKVYGFTREQITDWGYELNGKQHGSYTVCALFNFMKKEVVAEYKRDYGFVCEP